MWDAESGVQIAESPVGYYKSSALAFAPTGTTLAVSLEDLSGQPWTIVMDIDRAAPPRALGIDSSALMVNKLWPPDALNIRQGACGELVGYGYLPLPFTEPKATTAGHLFPL